MVLNVFSLYQQCHFDQLLVDLHIDAAYIKESMNIKWVAETGLVDAIESVVAVYREKHGLQVCVKSTQLNSVILKICFKRKTT